MNFKSIQVLRGFAAFFVVLYHSKVYMSTIGGNNSNVFSIFNELFSYGTLLFFAISGFIMAYLIDTEYKQFLLKRMIRIYPTYFIAATLCIMLKVILFGSITQPQLLRSLTLLPFGEINYPLFVEWTLVYEMFYYLVCSVFSTFKLKKLYPYFLGIWFLLVLIGSYYMGIQTKILPTINIIMFSVFNVSFIFGGLIYYLYKSVKLKSRVLNIFLALISLALIKITFNLSDSVEIISRIKYLIYAFSFSLIIYSSLNIYEHIKIKGLKLLEEFGNYSYALYLVHVPVITIGFSCLKNIGMPINNIVGIVVLLCALIAGWYFGKLDMLLHSYFKNKVSNISQRLKDNTVNFLKS